MGNLETAPDGLAKTVATHMLKQVKHQVDALTIFQGDWAEELHNLCQYSHDDLWLFMGIVTRAIYHANVTHRKRAAKFSDPSDPQVKAKVIWALMLTHILIDGMIAVKFRAHQVVTTAMNTFIMKTRVDRKVVEEMQAQLKAGLKQLAAQTQELAATKATVQGLGKDIQALQKKK